MTFRVQARFDLPTNDLEIFIMHSRPDGGRSIVTSLTMYSMAPGIMPPPTAGHIIAPELGTQREFMQAMLDGAWEAGLRPTGYGNVAEELRASDGHLQDMRAIAFGKLGIEKP